VGLQGHQQGEGDRGEVLGQMEPGDNSHFSLLLGLGRVCLDLKIAVLTWEVTSCCPTLVFN
jgi:hypothetical protein